MARYPNDGMVRVQWVPSIANTAAPTVAELNAGTNLTTNMTKDGLTVPSNQNMVEDGSLGSTFDAEDVGTYGGPIALTIKRTNASGGPDTEWNLIVYALTGFVVVRRGITTATAWAAAQKVEVYPVKWHHPLMAQTASNEQARFSAQAAVTDDPQLKATVAA